MLASLQTPSSTEPLRFVLRRETRASHERVDALFSTLDLADREDYGIFLQANALAYANLPVADGFADIETYLEEVGSLLAHDLRGIGSDVPRSLIEGIPRDSINPLAMRYVLGGASFGRRILHGRWSRSTDHVVLSAGAYLRSNAAAELWHAFLVQSNAKTVENADLNVLIADTNTIFNVFSAAFAVTATTASGERSGEGASR